MDIYYDKYSAERRNKYTKGRRLGEGAFGDVYHGTVVADSTLVALKYVRLSSRSKTIPRAVFREMEALRQCDCREIIKLLDIYPEETNLVLVLEYLPFDLAKYIDQTKNPIATSQVKYILWKILRGLAYCHSHRLVHRDLKPSNILISPKGEVKIADFGLARILTDTDDMSHQISTRWYRAPEILFGARRYDASVDLWAVGTIAAELFSLRPLFRGNNDIDQIFRVFQVLGTPTESSWPEANELPDFNKIQFPPMEPLNLRLLFPALLDTDIAFISKFLQLNPKQRITALDAFRDDYLVAMLPRPRFTDYTLLETRPSEADKMKAMRKMTPQQILDTFYGFEVE